MKKLIFFLSFLLVGIAGFSQLRTKTLTTGQQGTFFDYPGTYATANPAAAACDTLQVSDTVAYIIPIQHLNDITIYHQWYWLKSGAGTATMTVSFFQSNDPFNFVAVKAGAAQSAYTKVISLSATGWQTPISFLADTARFEGRYLKVQYMTSATASVGGKVFSRTKTNIK